MNPSVQLAIFRGMSDALHVCLDTGNREAVFACLANIDAAYSEGALTQDQYEELKDDIQDAGYDLQ